MMTEIAIGNQKPLVLVISGAGATGLIILKGLAEAGKWVRRGPLTLSKTELTGEWQRLAASVQPDSTGKPGVEALRELGVEIKAIDW